MRIATICLAGLLAAPAAADDFLAPANWEGRDDYWKLDGTTLTGSGAVRANTFFCSKKKYTDFELSFRVRLEGERANSGVQIRSAVIDPKGYVVKGPQCDIGQVFWGSLYGEKFGGMMKAAPKPVVKKMLKPGQFNDYSIRCVGKRVTIKLNGAVTVDQEFEKLPASGVIAFQLHRVPKSMTVTFKDMKFTDLAGERRGG